jgi:predicted outer membrane protein
MLIPMLILLAVQVPVTAPPVPTSGPPMPTAPTTKVVRRTGDATVLGAIGAADANAIEAATLASTKGSASEVRSLAATALKDHQRSLTDGTRIAKEERITRLLPADSAMARRQVDAMAAMNALSGDAFDHAFVNWLVIDHRALLEKDQRVLLSEVTRKRVKTFLRARFPMLRRHLAAGEAWLAAHP